MKLTLGPKSVNIYTLIVLIVRFKYMGERRNFGCKISATSSGWESIIKVDLRNIGCEDVNWIKLAQDRIQLCLL
jgi:hypothetical protein